MHGRRGPRSTLRCTPTGEVAERSQVEGRGSPGAALAAVAADRLTVAVALLDDHADVGLHQFGDVHDLQRRGEESDVSVVLQ